MIDLSEYKGDYWLFNINLNNKRPYDSNGNAISDWNGKKGKRYSSILKATSFDQRYNRKHNLGMGIKTGLQPNGDYIVGLDFDITQKVDGAYHSESKALERFEQFKELNPDMIGVWESSTTGNYGCLVKLDHSQYESLLELGQDKIKVDGLELMIRETNLVITGATKCKVTGEFRERKHFTDQLVLHSSEPGIWDYIQGWKEDYQNSNAPKAKSKAKKVKVKVQRKREIQADGLIAELVDNIDQKYIDTYDSSVAIIWALCSGDHWDVAQEFVSKSSHFIEKPTKDHPKDGYTWLQEKWDEYDPQKGITIGTVYHYSKISDEQQHNVIIRKYLKFDYVSCKKNDLDIADTFKQLKGDRWLFDSKQNMFYHFTGNYWKADTEQYLNIRTEIGNLSEIYFQKAREYQDYIEKSDEKSDAEKFSKIQKQFNSVGASLRDITKIKKVVDALKQVLHVPDIPWEENPYLVAFNNCVFDLRFGKRIDPSPQQYLLLSTGYDYREPTSTETDDLNQLLEQILPTKTIRDYYLTIMSTGLSAVNIPKFILLNGSGRNGKGTLQKLIKTTVGNYFHKVNVNVFTETIKTGGNPELANLSYKRLVMAEEPSEHTKLDVSTIKELTGGGNISVRKNHSNDTSGTKITATFAVECNKKPKLTSQNAGIAEAERLVDLPFESTFLENPTEKQLENPRVHRCDPTLNERIPTLKFAFVHELLQHFTQFYQNGMVFVEPDEISSRTKKYLANDDIYEWFIEHYELLPENERNEGLKGISRTELANEIKSDRSSGIKIKPKELNEYLENHIILRDYYEPEKKKYLCTKTGKNAHCKGILLYHRPIVVDEQVEEEGKKESTD